MKNFLFGLLFICFSAIAVQAQKAVFLTKNLDGVVTIKTFAGGTTSLDPQDGALIVKNNDKTITGYFETEDFKKAGFTQKQIDSLKAAPNFVKDLQQAAIAIYGPTTAKLTPFTWKGYSAYRTTASDADGYSYKILILLIKTTLYRFTVVSSAQASKEDAQAFMDGVDLYDPEHPWGK